MLRLMTAHQLCERQARTAQTFVHDCSWKKNQSLYLNTVAKRLMPVESPSGRATALLEAGRLTLGFPSFTESAVK